jgi:hypothetical protein
VDAFVTKGQPPAMLLQHLAVLAHGGPEKWKVFSGQREFSVVGLGSVWRDRKGYRNVPCFHKDDQF